jgi:hypothetical protein
MPGRRNVIYFTARDADVRKLAVCQQTQFAVTGAGPVIPWIVPMAAPCLDSFTTQRCLKTRKHAKLEAYISFTEGLLLADDCCRPLGA